MQSYTTMRDELRASTEYELGPAPGCAFEPRTAGRECADRRGDKLLWGQLAGPQKNDSLPIQATREENEGSDVASARPGAGAIYCGAGLVGAVGAGGDSTGR